MHGNKKDNLFLIELGVIFIENKHKFLCNITYTYMLKGQERDLSLRYCYTHKLHIISGSK